MLCGVWITGDADDDGKGQGDEDGINADAWTGGLTSSISAERGNKLLIGTKGTENAPITVSHPQLGSSNCSALRVGI